MEEKSDNDLSRLSNNGYEEKTESKVPANNVAEQLSDTKNDITPIPQDSIKIWYIQKAEGILGPCSIEELSNQFESGSADGMNYVWTSGMSEWKYLSDIPELEKHFLEVDEKLTDTIPTQRLPLEELPEEMKYITPEGIGQVYDCITKSWMSFADYRKILQTNPVDDNMETTNTEKTTDKSVTVEDNLMKKKFKNAESRRLYRERIKEKKKLGKWFHSKSNPNIYITGLPQDVTFDELETTFKRAGVIKIDPDTSKFKIKIYRDASGLCSGDALISFVNEASVDVAIKYMNGVFFRGSDYAIKVERAKFEPVHNLDHNVIPKDQVLEKKKILAARLEQRRLLSWNERQSDRYNRILIVRPLWTTNEAMKYPLKDKFYKSIAIRLKDWFSTRTEVVSVTPIERHPWGTVCIKFRTIEDCNAAVDWLNEKPFKQLNLSDREAEILFQQYLLWEKEHAVQLLQGSVNDLSNPDGDQLSLLEKFDDLMLREEEFLEFSDQIVSDPNANKRRRKNQNLLTLKQTESLLQFDLLERKRHFLQYIMNKPLMLEAYIYDGKTDLQGQALPNYNEETCDGIEKNEAEEQSTKHYGSHKWEELLNEGDSDDEDLIIATEPIDDE